MHRVLVALLSVVLASCVSYQHTPLDRQAVLDELRAFAVEVPSEGLDADQAVALALVNHPELRVWRREHEIAAGQVVSAAAWENPELRPSLQDIYSGEKSLLKWAAELRLFPRAPGETDALAARAKAREARTLAEIEDAESGIAVQTRIAHAHLVMLDTQSRLLAAAEQLHGRVADIVEQQVAAGVSTRIEASLVRLTREELAQERESLAARREISQIDLATLIGAAPDVQIAVRASPPKPASTIAQAELEQRALDSHPALRALAERYEEAEQRLRLVHIENGAWPTFVSVSTGKQGDDGFIDADGSIEIPLFDSGEADIAVATSRRDLARDAYRARLHTVRGEVRRASLELREQDRRHRALSQRLEPLLTEAEQLVRSALDAGAADPTTLVAIETRILGVRRDAATAAFERMRADAELAAATGSAFAVR